MEEVLAVVILAWLFVAVFAAIGAFVIVLILQAVGLALYYAWSRWRRRSKTWSVIT